ATYRLLPNDSRISDNEKKPARCESVKSPCGVENADQTTVTTGTIRKTTRKAAIASATAAIAGPKRGTGASLSRHRGGLVRQVGGALVVAARLVAPVLLERGHLLLLGRVALGVAEHPDEAVVLHLRLVDDRREGQRARLGEQFLGLC